MADPFLDMWAGPVKCPHCESFVDDEASHCPYCSMSLARSRWKGRWSAGEIVLGAVVGIILTGWTTWNALDPEITSAIKGLFADGE